MNTLQFVNTPRVVIRRSKRRKRTSESENVPPDAVAKADFSKVVKWVSVVGVLLIF